MQIKTNSTLRACAKVGALAVRHLRLVTIVGILAACGGDDSSGSGADASSPDAGSFSDASEAQAPDAVVTSDAASDTGSELDANEETDGSADDAAASAGGDADTDAAPGANDDVAAAAKNKLTSCGLLAGNAPVQLENLRSPAALCSVLCLANASCEQLTSKYCGATHNAALKACQDACAFVCTDGSSAGGSDAQCDGEQDCADGSDEAGCADYYFACGDGAQINSTLLCNGVRDCVDYSDEDSCETPFVCGGEILAPSALCNLVRECADGSDEAACPFVCGG